MPESSNNMYWTIAGILIAAVVISVVLIFFPQITSTITDFMSNMVSKASDRVNEAMNAGASLLFH